MIDKKPKGGVFVKTSSKVKLFIILGAEFIAVVVILLLVFLSGKETYTVYFELNGGALVSGELEQNVRKGNAATPPKAAKDGYYLAQWSTSYNNVNQDLVVEAIWERETSPGIEYNVVANSNYCTISGSFDDLQGEIYIGAKNGGLRVLGIEADAFKNCTGITKIHIADGLVTIGAGAFEGCSSLTSIEFPETLAVLGESAFKNCTALTEVSLPMQVKALQANTFYNCTSLESVVLPQGLESIGSSAFRLCSALKEVEIPVSVSSLSLSSFRDCTSLEKVILNEGLKTIYGYAFSGCTSLKEMTLPSTITGVGSKAFEGTQLVFENGYPELEGKKPGIPFEPGIIRPLEPDFPVIEDIE